MEMEKFTQAEKTVCKIRSLDNTIRSLEELVGGDTSAYGMQITSPTEFRSVVTVEHCGLLPEFLRMILEKRKEERAELEKELADI